GPEHPHVATSLNGLSLAWNQIGASKQGISYFERSLAINEQAYGPDHPDVATSLNTLGSAWHQLGQSKQALSYFERALAIYEQAYGPEHPHVATSLNNLGLAWNQLGESKQAISYFERALAINEQAYGPEHPHVATSLNNLGAAWNALGNPKEAISYFEQALAIREKVYGPDHSEVAVSLNNLGAAWDQLGDSKQAIGYFKRALAIHEQADGPEYPHVATILTNLGNACYQLGDPKQAIGYCERALAIAQQVCGPEHPNAATSLNILGGAYEKLGDWKQAFSYYKRTLAIHEQADGPEHPNVATSLNNLGEAWFQLGKPKQAISCYNRALAIREKTYGQEHPDVAMTLNNLGGAWDQLGDSKQAIRYFERALAIREKIYGPEHLEVAKRLDNLGGAWYKLGDWKQAFSYFERAFHIMKKAYGEHHPSTQRIKRNMEQLSGRLENNVEHQVGLFVKACVAGNEDLAISMPMRLFRKDLYDDKGNPLICWMAQHEMITTLEKVLKLGWNPNLPNTIQVYPLHYVAMKNPGLIQLLLPYADPFVQAAQGSTPAMVAKNKGKMKALSLLLPSITGLSLQNPAAFDTSYATCKAHFLATPTHSLEHLVQVFSLACHFKDWELARGVATRHNLRPIISQVTKQYPAAGKTLFACIDSFTEACKEGNDTLALEIAGQFTFEKDLYDAQGNPLICWMAQHAMTATLEQVLKLGWNPNLPNPRQVYPLHYGTMENPSLTSLLLQAGAHPFVQTPKGNTPAQVARNKGKVATLAVLLPSLEGISFEDAAAFEETYQAYKQRFSTHHQGSEEPLAALALALQLGDADLTLAIQAKQASQNLLEQLIDQYPLAAETIQARFESILKGTVDEQFPS
ncbi:MAG: tetratricopeptide repeat protein, partial [Cytophagales bacterium]|nr:tetratricopeptide repeat protein [Cytophagales bacterium]